MRELTPGPGDPNFFARTGPYRLAELAKIAGIDLDDETPIHGIAPLQTAGPGQVTFLDNRRYADLLGATKAAAVIIHPELAARVPANSVALPTATPYLVWAKVAALFFPPPPVEPGIHPRAFVDPAAEVDPTAEIGPGAVIGPAATIGARTVIGPNVVIGAGVSIGADCRIGALVSITHAVLGDRVHLLPGVRIGQEGFGFAQTDRGFLTVPQLGRVVIEDDVDVGANTTIDRGSTQDTVIGAGSRLDNLVQIAHNVRLGRCCVVVAQSGIAGSTILEDFVTVAAQVGINGHVRVGKGARIGAQSGVMSDLAAGIEVVGTPCEPTRDFFRGVATLRKLARRPNTAGNQSSD